MKDISEASASCKVARRLLEKDVQNDCVSWWRRRGTTDPTHPYWARKFSSQSQRSVPDYLFGRERLGLFAAKIKFACEFKRPGTKLTEKKDGTMSMSTEAQHEEQKAMRLAGWFVF